MEPIYMIAGVSVVIAIILVVVVIKLLALSSLIKELAGKIPGTAMTASELAEELGGSIDEAFRAYVPQPSELAEILTNSTQEAATKQLELGATLASGFGELVVKFDAALKGYASEVENSLRGLGEHWSESVSGTLSEHARQISEANQVLGAQIEKIATLEQQIVSVLHLQETMEGTIRELAASQEFEATLSALRAHLAESDQLLREAAKPRTIRLIEADGELAE